MPVVHRARHSDPGCHERRREAQEELERLAATTEDRVAPVLGVEARATEQIELKRKGESETKARVYRQLPSRTSE